MSNRTTPKMTRAAFSRLCEKGSGNSAGRMFLTKWTGAKRDPKTGLRKKRRVRK